MMNESNNILIKILLFIILIFIIIYLLNYNNYIKDIFNNINKSDTVRIERVDTLWRTDTFKIKELVPKEVIKVKTDTVFSKDGDTIQLVTENKLYQDTLICDKDTAELQIFTSGIKSNVDSINLNLRKSEIIKTNTVEITKYIEKPKTFWDRIHIQPQVTSGYDLINKQWGITAGIGVGIDL